MKNITRSYGNRKKIAICAAVLAVLILVLFITAFCVHDYAQAENKLQYLDFSDGKNYKLTGNYDKDAKKIAGLIDSGEYEKYDNIWKYDVLTHDGQRTRTLDFDTLVYYSLKNFANKYLIRTDETLPEKTVRCELYVCNQLPLFSREDFAACELYSSNMDCSWNSYENQDVFFTGIVIQHNITTRWDVNGKNYNVEPTYNVLQCEKTRVCGNLNYIMRTQPDGRGLSDNINTYYLTLPVIYCSPDIEVIGSDSPTWDKDALGV